MTIFDAELVYLLNCYFKYTVHKRPALGSNFILLLQIPSTVIQWFSLEEYNSMELGYFWRTFPNKLLFTSYAFWP